MEGPGTYGLPPTHSCGEATWASPNFDPGAPNFGENESFWLTFITCLVKFAIIHVMDGAIHEDRSVLSEKPATLGFREHISPHSVFREGGGSWAVKNIYFALINLVFNKKILVLMCFIPFPAERRPLISNSWALLLSWWTSLRSMVYPCASMKYFVHRTYGRVSWAPISL